MIDINEEIAPGSIIDILYDRENGTLQWIINGIENPNMKITNLNLCRGKYHLSAIWMKDNNEISIINNDKIEWIININVTII